MLTVERCKIKNFPNWEEKVSLCCKAHFMVVFIEYYYVFNNLRNFYDDIRRDKNRHLLGLSFSKLSSRFLIMNLLLPIPSKP